MISVAKNFLVESECIFYKIRSVPSYHNVFVSTLAIHETQPLSKWTTGGEKVSGYKLQCQKVYLAALPKCSTGEEKVSGYKLQWQKVYLIALPKCTTGGEKVIGNKLQCQKVYPVKFLFFPRRDLNPHH